MEAIFWGSLFGVCYPYVIYPAALVIWNRLFNRHPLLRPDTAYYPSVTVILPVHNEASRIEAKIENVLALEYPVERLTLLVVGDGCADDTLELAGRTGESRVTVLSLPVRSGKGAALNAGLARASGDIIVFTDVGILLDRSALAALVRHFGNPEVGCVSGEDYVEGGGTEGLYGRLELLLRREEARLHSIAGASGCFYGMRRDLCQPFRPGMAPDFLSVLDTVRSGHRALCEPLAHGAMSATHSQQAEFSRKTRTFLRGLTALFDNADLLNLLRYPAFAFVLWSHKVMRWLGPVALSGCLVAAFALREEPVYAMLWYMQLGFYGVGMAGLVAPGLAARFAPARLSAFYLLVNTAAARALVLWMAGVRQELWEPTRRPG